MSELTATELQLFDDLEELLEKVVRYNPDSFMDWGTVWKWYMNVTHVFHDRQPEPTDSDDLWNIFEFLLEWEAGLPIEELVAERDGVDGYKLSHRLRDEHPELFDEEL